MIQITSERRGAYIKPRPKSATGQSNQPILHTGRPASQRGFSQKLSDTTRPQSVLPTDRSELYFCDNSTGFIRPESLISTSATIRPRPSGISSRCHTLPFSNVTLRRLANTSDTFGYELTNNLRTPGTPFSTNRTRTATPKTPIFTRLAQTSRSSQTTFRKHLSLSNSNSVSLHQYRNYLRSLCESDAEYRRKLVGYYQVEKNEVPMATIADANTSVNESMPKNRKVKYTTTSTAMHDDFNTINQRRLTEENCLAVKEKLKAVRKCNTWIERNIEYLTPSTTPRPQSSTLVNGHHRVDSRDKLYHRGIIIPT